MAIRYYSIPHQKKTVAILENTAMDCVNKINKKVNNFCWCTDKYVMPNRFRVTVTCSAEDVYDEEVGRKMAKEKLLKRYYKHLDKRYNMFIKDLVELNNKVFENA